MNENITLKIDNREISVPKGTTILEAARELGIDIPTLCYMNLKDLCIKNAPAFVVSAWLKWMAGKTWPPLAPPAARMA